MRAWGRKRNELWYCLVRCTATTCVCVYIASRTAVCVCVPMTTLLFDMTSFAVCFFNSRTVHAKVPWAYVCMVTTGCCAAAMFPYNLMLVCSSNVSLQRQLGCGAVARDRCFVSGQTLFGQYSQPQGEHHHDKLIHKIVKTRISTRYMTTSNSIKANIFPSSISLSNHESHTRSYIKHQISHTPVSLNTHGMQSFYTRHACSHTRHTYSHTHTR